MRILEYSPDLRHLEADGRLQTVNLSTDADQYLFINIRLVTILTRSGGAIFASQTIKTGNICDLVAQSRHVGQADFPTWLRPPEAR